MARTKDLIQIHAAVLLFGLAGLFGKWIDLPPAVIVFGRVLFASVALWAVHRLQGRTLRLRSRSDYYWLGLQGFILAVHWTTFFLSIQLSTVAIGLLTFSTFPVFTVFLEPLFFREESLGWLDLLLAGLTVLGIFLIVPDFRLDNQYTLGAFWGVVSGFTFAVLSVLNRKFVRTYSGLTIAFYQDLVAMLLLFPVLFLLRPSWSLQNTALLIVLGVVFTAISHTLFINGLQTVRAKTASIIGSLEPVYGILAAAWLLQEVPSAGVLLGGSLILVVSALDTWRSMRGERKKE